MRVRTMFRTTFCTPKNLRKAKSGRPTGRGGVRLPGRAMQGEVPENAPGGTPLPTRDGRDPWGGRGWLQRPAGPAGPTSPTNTSQKQAKGETK